MIAIVNYEMGNLRSIQNAMEFLGLSARVTSDTREIADADKLILPGVGAFNVAMANIARLGLSAPILEAVQVKRKPILGICLGMQLLAASSTEDGLTSGFSLLDATVERFPGGAEFPSPHVGFNSVHISTAKNALFSGIEDGSDFYFVHNYRMASGGKDFESGLTCYGGDFVSAVEQENVFGVQFHPEKSQSNGLKLLSNFIRL